MSKLLNPNNNNYQLQNMNFNNNIEINKIYLELNEFISSNVHINLFKKLKEIFQINDSKKISDLQKFLDDIYIKLKSINEKMNNITLDELYFSKYFTLLYSLYPFFSKNQKESTLNSIFSNNTKNILPYKELLINLFHKNENEEYSNIIYDFLFTCLTNDKKKEILNKLNKIIFRISPNNKEILYHLYLFCMISKKITKTRESFYISIKFLIFKIRFILSNYRLFSFTFDEFAQIYKCLYFIKNFYFSIYNKEIKEPCLIKNINNVLVYNDNKLIINENSNISILFTEKININYEKILDLNCGIIPHFYNIGYNNINNIIDYSSYYIKKERENFLYNLIHLVNLKYNFIEKNFNTYKNNLINLEKEIFTLAKKNLINNENKKAIKNYSQKTEYKYIYDTFLKKLNEQIYGNYKNKYKNSFKLYPIGSLTEFLSSEESDIDLFLYIKNENKRIEIIEVILESLKTFCKSVKKIISQVCVFQIKFVIKNKEENIDLNILGFPPYIHSFLFREYSLLDPRFPMIGIAIKYIKDILCLDKKFFLNSFCWMNLLVNFLQDIIYPPVLPKLYSNKSGYIIYKDVEFGNNKNKNGAVNKESIKNFIFHLNKEKIPILDNIFDKNKKYIKKI